MKICYPFTNPFFRQALTLVLLVGLMLGMLPASTTLASTQTDLIGPLGSVQFGKTVTVLPNGNIVVTDPGYSVGAKASVGAVYLYNGSSGVLISTLTGSTANDLVGSGANLGAANGITVLPNSSYVVSSPNWSGAGAATWCSGAVGCTGVVSASNSLVGSKFADLVGVGITALTNGNYVVSSFEWSNGALSQVGAVTWCSGTGGCTGAVSASNSLVGSTKNDWVGLSVTALTNGNYVVSSTIWNNGAATHAGAATWCSGTVGCTGAVSASNSLVGSTVNDQIGSNRVTVLPNGNYVVSSSNWDNGAAEDVGAVTWCGGTVGCTGAVSASNSLVGGTVVDLVGNLGVTALTNSNYVVASSNWHNGGASGVGAVTRCSGIAGCTGAVSVSNSLVGSTTNDHIGYSVKALTNGNYVAGSFGWDNGAATDVGVAKWCSGTVGCTGVVSTSNSLVGSTVNDDVSLIITALTNGNYVVSSPNWDNGAATDAGEVTWCSGTVGCTGVVSASNSLVGSTASDFVGGGMVDSSGNVTALTNGNYVVGSPNWDNGGASGVGAVTLCSGTAGCTGVVSVSNSLVGSTTNDHIGFSITALTNGNYVVRSPNWNNGAATYAGAATWCSGTVGCTGVVSASNSLVGSTVNDYVGSIVTALTNGNYVVVSWSWDNGAATNAGAISWCGGTPGCTGAVTNNNSVLGTAANGGANLTFAFDIVNNQLVVGRPTDNRVTLFKTGAPAPTIYNYLPLIRR